MTMEDFVDMDPIQFGIVTGSNENILTGSLVQVIKESSQSLQCHCFQPITHEYLKDTIVIDKDQVCLLDSYAVNSKSNIKLPNNSIPPFLSLAGSKDPFFDIIAAALHDWVKILVSKASEPTTLNTVSSAIHFVSFKGRVLMDNLLTKKEQSKYRKLIISTIQSTNALLNLDCYLFDEVGNLITGQAESPIDLLEKYQACNKSSSINQDVDEDLKFQVCIQFTAFVGLFSEDINDTIDLNFCIFDGSTNQALSEEFIVTINRNGNPVNPKAVSATFINLSVAQQQGVYILCRLTRNCNVEGLLAEIKGNELNSIVRRKTVHLSAQNLASSVTARRPIGYSIIPLFRFFKTFGSSSTNNRTHLESTEVVFPVNLTPDDADFSKYEVAQVNHRQSDTKIITQITITENLERDCIEKWSDSLHIPRNGTANTVIPPNDTNVIYITIERGKFITSKSANYAIQVSCQVRLPNGQFIPNCIHRGYGIEPMDRYHSIIFNKVTNPIWHESIKVDLPPSMMQQCHLFFTFRNFGKLKLMDDSPENIFAFAFLPLVQGQNVMIQNASHCLTLYKYQESLARPDIYLSFSAGPNIIVPVHLSASSITTISDGADALSKLPALEHTLTVITSVFSSFITQDIHLSNLINWKRTGAFNRSPMKEVLLNFQNVGEMEIVNFSRPLFHSFIDMFNEMDSTQGGKLFDIVVPVQEDVFQCFTFYLGIMLDKRFTPQLKRLLEDLNNHSSYKYPLQKLVESCIAVVGQVESLKGGKLFRKFVRVWHLVVSCIVTSCHKDPSIVDSFCQSLLTSIGSIFTIASHDHVLASQSLAMQKLGMLVTTFKESTTVTFSLMKSVMNSIDRTIATLEVLKLRLIADLIKNQVFDNVLMEMDDLRDYGLNMALPEDDNIPETGGVYESLLSARVMVCMYILKGLNGLDDSKISASLCRKLLLFNLRLFLQLKSKNEIEWKPLDVNQVVRSATITQRPVSAPESNKFDLSTTVQNNLSLIIAFPKCLSLEDLTNVLKPLLYDESFLSDFLHAAWLILDRSPWEESWITLNVESIRSLVTYLNVILSLYPESYRSRDFSNATVIKTHQDIWRVFVEVLTKYMGSSILHLESFSYQKARFFQTTVGDLRLDLAKLLQRALNTIEMLEENYKLGLTVPHTVIQELFTLYLQPKNTLKTSLLELISECSRMEYQKSGNLKIIENSFYHSLHCLILSGVDKSDVKFIHDMEDYFRDSSMTSLLKPVFKNLVKFYPLCVQQYEIESAANGDQISTTVRTLRFLRHVRQKDLFVQYVQKLHRMHLEIGNLIEAAFVLKQQASLLKWRSDVLMDENQSLGFPSYLSEFELHESIYLECIRLLDDGGAWERAIELTRELEYQYEHMTFEYTKLSQLLKYRVILYDKIVECDRTFPNYFRVAFYGQGFQNKLSGKQFIFKGENWEKLDAFCDRMERLYSPVTIISTKGSIDPSIISTSGRVLQINLVDSVPDIRIWSKSDPSMLRGPLGQVNWDIDSKIKNVVPADGEIPMWLFVPELQWDDLEIQQLLRKKDSLPLHLTSYYENNELTMFALNRPLRKTMPAIENHPAQEILEVWNEKTIFFIENSLPYLSRQSRVVQTVTFQTSPIENAIICIRTKTRELLEYERKYSPLADEHHVNPSTESGGNKNVKRPIVIEKIPLNINPFSMALSGAVDAAVNGGIALYKSAFLSAYDLEQAHLQQTLEKAILEQVEVIDRCIKIHKVLVPREMYPLHEHIVKSFQLKFQAEIPKIGMQQSIAPSLSSHSESRKSQDIQALLDSSPNPFATLQKLATSRISRGSVLLSPNLSSASSQSSIPIVGTSDNYLAKRQSSLSLLSN